MDSYNKDIHRKAKQDRSSIINDDISSMDESGDQSRSHFGGDEPLDVPLRFDLGSFADADVLVDTHGNRESHWDFVREERGSFQVATEGNTTLMAHVKPDDNSESWCSASSQSNAQLFLDPREDAALIAEAFDTKDMSMAQAVEPESVPAVSDCKDQSNASTWVDGRLKEETAFGVASVHKEETDSEVTISEYEGSNAQEATTSNADNPQIQEHRIEESKAKNNKEHKRKHLSPDQSTEPSLHLEGEAQPCKEVSDNNKKNNTVALEGLVTDILEEPVVDAVNPPGHTNDLHGGGIIKIEMETEIHTVYSEARLNLSVEDNQPSNKATQDVHTIKTEDAVCSNVEATSDVGRSSESENPVGTTKLNVNEDANMPVSLSPESYEMNTTIEFVNPVSVDKHLISSNQTKEADTEHGYGIRSQNAVQPRGRIVDQLDVNRTILEVEVAASDEQVECLDGDKASENVQITSKTVAKEESDIDFSMKVLPAAEKQTENIQNQEETEVNGVADCTVNPTESHDKTLTTENKRTIAGANIDKSFPVNQESSEREKNRNMEEIAISSDMRAINQNSTVHKQSGSIQDISQGFPLTVLAKGRACGSNEPISAISSDVSQQPASVSQRKSDAARNNRLKDSARASPIQARSDHEPGKERSGRRKRTVKFPSQYSLDGYGSPPKSGSKSSSVHRKRKGISALVIQDVKGSSQGFISPNSNVSSSTRQQKTPLLDLNVVDATLHTRPFSEPQQVQLRAQILVYGSLIQGAAPEEALMVAAFSNGSQGEGGTDPEGSGRNLWEKQWRKAVDRNQAKNTINTAKVSTNSSSLTLSSAKASESPKTTKNIMGAKSLNSRPTDVKDNPSRLKQSAEAPSKSSVVNMTLNLSPSTIVRQIPSTVNENYMNQNSTPQTSSRSFFPMPPQLPVPPSAPQWIPPPTFSSPWGSQPPSTINNAPSALAGYGQAMPSSDISLPGVSIVPTLSTPVLGSLSMIPNSIVISDVTQKIKTPSESRPRKRKKTDPEACQSPSDVIARQLATSNVPHIGHTTTSSQFTSNLLTSSEPLPVFQSNNHVTQIASSDKLSVANPSRQLSSVPPTLTSELALQRPEELRKLENQLEQAKVNAEEASSVADSAVRESVSIWSQLRAQKLSGTVSDVESQLSSSVIAATTAASVAKAAAAAARAAYEAAIQAKTMGENALEARKPDTTSQSPRPENCNSIITAAKMASKKRLEAASAAITRAQNFDLIVRAAELANTAVSQVGAIMTMGESFPFTFEMLLESGPEGLHRLLSLQDKDINNQGQILQSTGAGNKNNLGESPSFKDLPSHYRTDGIAAISCPGNSNDMVGGSSTEKAISDHVATANPQDSVNQFVKDSHVEVMSDKKGICGVWFSARVQNIEAQKLLVVYDYLLSDDGSSALKEWVDMEGSPSKAPKVRLAHRSMNISSKKRKRELMGIPKWSVGDRVDAFIRDGWWEGEIKEVIEDGDSKAKVFLLGDGRISLIKTSILRPSMVWRNGHWVSWNKIKKGENTLKASNTIQETPVAKRQKTDKAHERATNGSGLKQKMVGASASGKALSVKEGAHSDNKLQKDVKGSALDGGHKIGSKNAFGGAKQTKKRKLIEVGKHYISNKGAKGVSTGRLADGTSEFHIRSKDTNKLDGFQSKKNTSNKVKSQKGLDNIGSTQSKGKGQKEKSNSDAKTSARKHLKTKEGLPSSANAADLKWVRKKAASTIDETEFERSAEATLIPTAEKSNEELSSVVEKESVQEAAIQVSQIGSPEQDTKTPTSPVQSPSTIIESNHQPFNLNQHNDEQVKESSSEKTSQLVNGSNEKCKESIEQTSQSVKESCDLEQETQKELQPSKLVEESEKETPLKENEIQISHADTYVTKDNEENKDTEQGNENEKESPHASKDGKGKDSAKSEVWEPRRTSRKIQPTSKLLEGLQTAPKVCKGMSHDKGSRSNAKGTSSSAKFHQPSSK